MNSENIDINLAGIFALVEFEPRVPDASSGDGILRTWEQCKEWADICKCDLKIAPDNQLFIDLDTEESFKQFTLMMGALRRRFSDSRLIHHITPSKQGLPHRHIVVTLPGPLPLLARIALQACMGSDPMRELLSVRRALDGEDNVVIFFEPRS